MDALTQWWRGLGGLLAAAVVALLVVGPGIDTIICAGEDAIAVGAPDHGPVLSAADDHHPADAPGTVDHNGACPHGHCHHVAADRAAYVVAAVDAPAATARLPIPQARAPTSDLRYGLERPPRA
jgi:hypothetical protein